MILALTLAATAATATAVAFNYTSSSVKMGSKTLDLLKARNIAEAGMNIAYNQLRSDITLASSQSSWPSVNFDGGSYVVTPTLFPNNQIILASVGTFRGTDARVRMDLRYYPSAQVSTGDGGSSGGSIYGPYVFTNVLYISGTCDWAGCGTFDGGAAYVNGAISMKGSASWGNSSGSLYVASSTSVACQGAAAINATTIKAPSIGSKGITGTKIVGAVATPILPAIELSPFYEVARQNHQVVSNTVSIPNGFTPPGGVLWCEGSLKFKGTATGCFIATAGVSMEAGADVYPSNPNWPTIYVKTGGCSFTGQANTHGFVFSGGDVKFTGGGALMGGPVIIIGNLSKGGNSDMTDAIPASGFVITPPVVNPQQYSNTVQRLVVIGWQ